MNLKINVITLFADLNGTVNYEAEELEFGFCTEEQIAKFYPVS